MRSPVAASRSTIAATLRILPAVVAACLALAGCSGGSDAMTGPQGSAPTVDLDTSKAPPQTVTASPLLPPVPDAPASQMQPLPGAAPEAGAPLQYDHLYSEEEQLQIKSDLAAAAARAQRN